MEGLIMELVQKLDYENQMQANKLCKLLIDEAIIYITNIFENALIDDKIKGYNYYLNAKDSGYDVLIYSTDFSKEKQSTYDYVYSISIKIDGDGIKKVKVEVFIDGLSDTIILNINSNYKQDLKQVLKAIDNLINKLKSKYKIA
ncbi:MAG: hypothetical protein WAP21_06895 [Bacteroidales bacterium]